jgi:hypothetical protein
MLARQHDILVDAGLSVGWISVATAVGSRRIVELRLDSTYSCE